MGGRSGEAVGAAKPAAEARTSTADEKLKILEEARQPGTTVAEVLRRHEVEGAADAVGVDGSRRGRPGQRGDGASTVGSSSRGTSCGETRATCPPRQMASGSSNRRCRSITSRRARTMARSTPSPSTAVGRAPRSLRSIMDAPPSRRQYVTVTGMALEGECEREMFVVIRWPDRPLAVPLAQLEVRGLRAVDPDTREAVADWHSGLDRDHCFRPAGMAKVVLSRPASPRSAPPAAHAAWGRRRRAGTRRTLRSSTPALPRGWRIARCRRTSR